MALTPAYQHIVDTCEPFVISYPANWPHLDMSPLGFAIAPERRYTATSLGSRDVVDGLHHLDAVTFGDQDMLMPRWVLFDCGEFPGIVFGFGREARHLPGYVRGAYHVSDRDDAFVPLSMWVAIRCAEDDAWFGHNLSSANLILQGDDALPGLATITKTAGVAVTRCKKQYGATQWTSKSIGLHLRLGEMELLSAYTPAHTHPETFAYRIDVDPARLARVLAPDFTPPPIATDHSFAADDVEGIRKLHDRIERGERWQLIAADRQADGPTVHRLRHLDMDT